MSKALSDFENLISNIIKHCLHVSYLSHEDEVHHGGVGHHAAGRLQAREDDAGVAEVCLAPWKVVTGHLEIELLFEV